MTRPLQRAAIALAAAAWCYPIVVFALVNDPRELVGEVFLYVVLGGLATILAGGIAVLVLVPLVAFRGFRIFAARCLQSWVLLAYVFVLGIPANALFTALMRHSAYVPRDALVDWLPFVPSGGWVVDFACGGYYLPGASATTLASVWAVLALPTWLLAWHSSRRLRGRVHARLAPHTPG